MQVVDVEKQEERIAELERKMEHVLSALVQTIGMFETINEHLAKLLPGWKTDAR